MPVSSASDALKVMVLPIGESQWRSYGASEFDAGIVPEGFTMSEAMPGGADTCQFTLRRNLAVSWPDINPFDPLEVYVGGVKVFKGRIRETPMVSDDAKAITVIGEGMQYYLTDTVLDLPWVHSTIGEWRDARAYPNQDTGRGVYASHGTVVFHHNGTVHIGFPDGATAQISDAVGIIIDLGPFPSQYPKRIVVDLVSAAGNANYQTFIKSGDIDGATGAVGPTQNADLSSGRNLNGSAGSQSYTFATDSDGNPRSRRYIGVYLRNVSGSALGVGGAIWAHITGIRLFYKTGYESGNLSVLKTSDVIKDSVAFVPAVSGALTTDTPAGYIQPTQYNITEYDTKGYKAVRDIINDVNAFYGWDWWVDVNGAVHYTPAYDAYLPQAQPWTGANDQLYTAGDFVHPTVPNGHTYTVIVGGNPGPLEPTWPTLPGSTVTKSGIVYMEYTPPAVSLTTALKDGAKLALSGASGQNLYSDVIVTGRDGSNFKTKVRRKSLSNPTWLADSTVPQPTNPDFEVSTAGWTPSIGSLSRDTAQFHSGAASLKLTADASGTIAATTASWTANFVEGEQYLVEVWFLGVGGGVTLAMLFALQDHYKTGVDLASTSLFTFPSAQFHRYTFPFTADFTGPATFRLFGGKTGGAGTVGWIDDVKVYRNATGLLGRRKLTRTAVLPINAKLSKDDATQIGDAFLKTTSPYPPFRGTLTVAGNMVRDAQSNEPIPPWMLQVGQVIQVADIPDPNRGGAMGRAAKIVAVTYNHDERSASLELDNSRDWTLLLRNRLRRKVSVT